MLAVEKFAFLNRINLYQVGGFVLPCPLLIGKVDSKYEERSPQYNVQDFLRILQFRVEGFPLREQPLVSPSRPHGTPIISQHTVCLYSEVLCSL